MIVERNEVPVTAFTTPPLVVDYLSLIKKAAEHVKAYMQEHANPDLKYHNLKHTEKVVTAATQIAHHYGLRGQDFFVVVTAAWFHDLGYFENMLSHELVSAQMAEAFLKSNGVEEAAINDVKGCIMATRVPQNPTTQLEQIVCDADFYHFGTDDFMKANKLLRKEVQAIHKINISKEEWHNRTVHLMESHHFHTDYCNALLKRKKRQNLERIKTKYGAQVPTTNYIDEMLREHLDGKNNYDEMDKTYLLERPERGVDTLFRISSGISQRLNEQADNKAHILISVNAIIMSVFLTIVVRRMEEYTNLVVPITMFLIVNLFTIVFAILATRPNSFSGIFKPIDVEEKKVNLLFFGSFYKMDFDEYAKGLFNVIGDKHFLYLSLIRNLYDMGILLGKKYRMLKVAYNIFMFGLIVSVVAFVIASEYFP